MFPTGRLVAVPVLCCFLSCLEARGISERERLSGFAEQRKENEQFQRARERGEQGYYEELDQIEAQKRRDLEAYRKTKKNKLMAEDGPEAKEDEADKKRYQAQYEEQREIYFRTRTKQEILDRKKLGLPSEAQELGLDENRPRYDYRKRATYGATPKFGKKSVSAGSSSSGGFSGSSSPSFPPPPTFDDFGNQDGGFIPAPNMDDFGDVPPPPPPPPPPFGDDFGGGFGGGFGVPPNFNDFPPPPPPPPFGEGDF